MFDNVGKKLKLLTKVFVVLTVIGWIILSIFFFIDGEPELAIAILIVGIVALLIVYIGCLFIYGFADLIEDTREIKEALIGKNDKARTDGNTTIEEQISDVSAEAWKCTWCGKINKNDIKICPCGSARVSE